MIKRWIARQRRRLDAYGRLRRVESRLSDLAVVIAKSEAQAERLSAMEETLATVEQQFLRQIAQAQDDQMAALNDRMAEAQRWAEDTAQDTREAMMKSETAIAAANALAVRTARLEAQRQLDFEASQKVALASLAELKRTIIQWRNADDALAQIDRSLPSRRYPGRPWEDQRPRRLSPSLTKGLPFLEAGASGKLHMVALGRDGAPTDALPSSDLPDDVWIAFAPLGSVASPAFSSTVLEQIDRHPDAAVFYADDLAVRSEEAINQIRLKPEFDITLLSAQDYVGAPLIVRLDSLRALGGLNVAHGTAACADFLFRASARGMVIRRIPEVLLAHPGRRIQASASDYRAMLQAQPSLDAYEVTPGATVGTFRLKRRFTAAEKPMVSVLIPTRRTQAPDSNETYVERLLASLAATDWPLEKLTVLVGDDIPGSPEWARRKWPFKLHRIETLRASNEPFNYAAKMNRLWRAAETEQIVFMNDDVRALDGGWLEALQTFSMDAGVGGVGARLLFEDGSLQHAGMAPHGAGTAHLWIQRLGSQGVYQDWALVHREWSMVTGAVFATRRTLMEEFGGFDERFSLEFNDTDLALRLRAAGYRIVSTPFAQMVHTERASRRDTPPPAEEAELFYQRWSHWLANDPSWHPGLDLNRVEVMPSPISNPWYL
jgi:GT2 family glycosyltransferase